MRSQRSSVVRCISYAAMAAVMVVSLGGALYSQTFNTLYNFTGGLDGSNPGGQPVMDPSGNLYVHGYNGGAHGYGAVDLRKHTSGTLQPLYEFAGGNDGEHGDIIRASNGSLYGASNYGGGAPNCGTIFHLQPSPTIPPTPLSQWNETILYRFQNGSDGCNPWASPIFDPADNLDGTTVNGGTANAGTIYQLVPSGGSWTETVLHTFHGGPSDGANPYVGLVSDSSGNLYGVTITGGTYGYGIVFKLSDTGAGYSILYNFTNGSDGGNPNTALIVDSTGVLYGTTSTGGTGGGGTVFKLTPVGGGYSFSVLYNLVGPAGSGPTTGWLSMDAAGNIYGTTVAGGTNQLGSVFKLTPSGNGYTYTDLHDFTCGSDGCSIYGGVVLDSSGNLYGTASSGGAHNDGVIFEITP